VSSNPFKTLRRHREFRRLWMSAVISDLGTWMQAVTVSVLVADASKSSGATALVFSSLFIPQALISPVGGLVADRFDRRMVAMTMQWIQAVLAAVLAIVIHNGVRDTLPLTIIVLIQGVAQALSNPAYGSMIPLLVPREELLGALSLSGMTWNTGRAVGPALAALTITIWGPAASIAGNAVSYALMGLVLLTIKRPLHGGGTVRLRQFRSEIRESARKAFTSTTTRTMMLTTSVMQLFVSLLFSTVPTYARQVDDWKRLPMALFACMGVGALVGAFSITAVTARIGRSRVATLYPSMAALAILLASIARSAPMAFVALFLFGMFGPVSFISFGAVVQRDAPEHSRGRILSIYSAGVGFSFGAFSIASGYIADHGLGLRHTMLVCSIGLWASVIAVRLVWKNWSRIINGNDADPRWRPGLLPRFPPSNV
jgi:MFS family permease